MTTEDLLKTKKKYLIEGIDGIKNFSGAGIYTEDVKELMIYFARVHVNNAIRAIVKDNHGNMNDADIPYLQKSYPIENIQ